MYRLAKITLHFYIKENISLPVSLIDIFTSRLYIFIFSTVLGQKSDDPVNIDNIRNVFVFKKTTVSKGQASLRRYERLQERQKNSSSKISSVSDATDESTRHKQQHQVSQGKFSKRFSGIYIYFIILLV